MAIVLENALLFSRQLAAIYLISTSFNKSSKHHYIPVHELRVDFITCSLNSTSVFAKCMVGVCKSKDRQHNGQTKMDKKRNNDLQGIAHKTKD
jgi:hypothetical protein